MKNKTTILSQNEPPQEKKLHNPKWLDKCESIQGWMGKNELLWLYGLAKWYDNIVEIGSWKGRSTYALCKAGHAKITAVDHFLGTPNERNSSHKEATERDIFIDFKKNCGRFKNLTILKMDSIEASKLFKDNSIDVVFIDGDHTYEGITNDLTAWYPKVKHMICGHDGNAVEKALQNFFNKEKIPRIIGSEFSSWYVLKN